MAWVCAQRSHTVSPETEKASPNILLVTLTYVLHKSPSPSQHAHIPSTNISSSCNYDVVQHWQNRLPSLRWNSLNLARLSIRAPTSLADVAYCTGKKETCTQVLITHRCIKRIMHVYHWTFLSANHVEIQLVWHYHVWESQHLTAFL